METVIFKLLALAWTLFILLLALHVAARLNQLDFYADF